MAEQPPYHRIDCDSLLVWDFEIPHTVNLVDLVRDARKTLETLFPSTEFKEKFHMYGLTETEFTPADGEKYGKALGVVQQIRSLGIPMDSKIVFSPTDREIPALYVNLDSEYLGGAVEEDSDLELPGFTNEQRAVLYKVLAPYLVERKGKGAGEIIQEGGNPWAERGKA
ncbi:MAG TPA: hypothetical protein VJ110_01535 [Candidatus Nanoarchaeia archaeon]|nr:hypothetical protein [Candidatus Nanoarchaeia archaeon]